MFCIKCGSEIPEGGAFCTKCGTRVAAPQETQPQKSDTVSLRKSADVSAAQRQTEEKPKQETVRQSAPQTGILVQETAPKNDLPDSEDAKQRTGLGSVPPEPQTTAAMHDTLLEKIVYKNQAYYKSRFEELQKGGRDHINWAAFFLGLLHASYRNSWKAWIKALWMPLTLYAVSGLVGILLIFSNPQIAFVLFIVSFAAGIWSIVTQVRYAKRFNRTYMDHVEQKIMDGDTKADPSALRVVLAWLVLTGFTTCVWTIVSAVAIQIFFSALSDMDFDEFWEQNPVLTEQIQPDLTSEEPPVQTPDTPPAEPVEPTIPTVQMSSLLKDYTGAWMVDRYNNFMDGYVGFDLEAREGQLYLTISAVWEQGDRLTTISDVQLELNAEGTSGGAPYEDDRGNMGDVMLFIENGTPYLTVTVRGDHQYGIEMEYERCSREKQQQEVPMETTKTSEDGPEYWFYWFDAMQTFSNEIYTMEDLAKRTIGSEYLWPSDFMQISEGYLNEVTQVEVAMIRNEIFARHGYIFSSPAWDAFFRTASWYVPNSNYSEDMLSVLEKENLKIITEYEKAHGWK